MDPEEFLERVVAAGHPASFGSYLPETLRSCISRSLGMTASERVAARASALKFWLRTSPELRTVETEIHAKLDSGVEEVVRGKRIALWKEMLESIGYSDLGVVDEFCSGATLTGPTCPTGLWPKQFTPATLTEEELQQQATVQRRHLTYSQVVFFGEEIARSVWKQTLDEVAKGELEGPLALDDIPLNGPLSKSLGVEQGGKVRCVDDFSASGVNAAAQPLESPKPHTLDVVAGMIPTVMKFDGSGEKWNIRSFDLKSAYRQCAVHPQSPKFAVIAVGDPTTKTLKAFRLKAPPIGQREVGALLFESGTQHLDNPDHHLSDNHNKLF